MEYNLVYSGIYITGVHIIPFMVSHLVYEKPGMQIVKNQVNKSADIGKQEIPGTRLFSRFY